LRQMGMPTVNRPSDPGPRSGRRTRPLQWE
jgi:hypothetical protein